MSNSHAVPWKRLADEARLVSERAYCPYSHFPVGVAGYDDRGQIHVGCNVENASYGLTLCAERNAIVQMVASGGRKVLAMVIYTRGDQPSTPCGACRQVLYEFGPNPSLLCLCEGGSQIEIELKDLLPMAFGPHDLDSAATETETRESRFEGNDEPG